MWGAGWFGKILSGACFDDGSIFGCVLSLLYGASGFPEPHFDLEFWLTLPWVLDEPVDGPTKK